MNMANIIIHKIEAKWLVKCRRVRENKKYKKKPNNNNNITLMVVTSLREHQDSSSWKNKTKNNKQNKKNNKQTNKQTNKNTNNKYKQTSNKRQTNDH